MSIIVCLKSFEVESFVDFEDDHSVTKVFLQKYPCTRLVVHYKRFIANCSSEYSLTQQSMKLFLFKTFYIHDMLQGHVKEFSTGGGAEGILCGVMKLKNMIFAKSREYENIFSQKSFEF